MKLELKHLAPYLPYGLKFQYTDGLIFTMNSIPELFGEHHIGGENKSAYTLYTIKPILHPLSDLTKEIEHNGERFVPMKKLLREVGLNYPIECYNQDESWILYDGYRALGEFPHRKVQLLFEWHFDVFNLIPNLAIDINTLK